MNVYYPVKHRRKGYCNLYQYYHKHLYYLIIFINLTTIIIASNCLTEPAVCSLNASDHKARMRKIETEGNSPEEWKAYIDFLKTVPSEGDIHIKPLTEAYSRAFTVSALPSLPCV